MKKRYLKSSCLFVLVLMLLAVIFPAGAFAQPEVKTTAATTEESVIGVSYRGHVQNLGNVPTPEGTMIAGPEALGTTGKGLRMEGFWIDLTGDVPANAGIRYQVHVQNVGWQDVVNSGDFAGTNARGLRIEAIKISLVNLPDYDVYYRGHVQNVGNIPQIDGDWGWVKNGEELGTTGKGLRLEELQIKIVRKGIDLTAYNTLLNTIEKLDAANYSPESWATLQTALTDNKMTEANSQTSIDAAIQAIQAAYDALSLKVVAVYDKPGVYGPETGTQTIEGSVIIDVIGVTLQNLVIKGDLTVSEAVGDGDATLNNLTVEGATILAGGGTGGATLAGQATSGDMTLAGNSGGITIKGSVLTKVLVKKNDGGGIRITLFDTTLGQTEIIDIPEGQPIILAGWFKSVNIEVPDLKLEVAGGTIVDRLIAGSADAQSSASGLAVTGSGHISNFEVGKFSDNVTVGADVWISRADIYGDNAKFSGHVSRANIVGDNAGFNTLPDNYTGNPPVIINPPAPPPGGGGGGVSTTPVTAVAISGDAVVGQALTAITTPSGATVTYQWMRSSSDDATGAYDNITSATTNTYTLQSGDAGRYIKVKVTGNGSYSETVTSTAGSKVLNTQSAPTGLDSVAPTTAGGNGKITGTTTAMEYKLKAVADNAYADCTATETTGLAAGTYVVRLKAVTDVSVASPTTEVTVLNKVAAPTGLSGVAPTTASDNDGKITGTTDLMEYKLKAAADNAYADCTATETIGLAAGTYAVRVKAVPGVSVASDPTDVTVSAYGTKYAITIANVNGGTAAVTTNPETEAEPNTTVTVSISNIGAGKQFKSISVTDSENQTVTTTTVGSGTSYTFTMPERPVTVTVTVEQMPGSSNAELIIGESKTTLYQVLVVDDETSDNETGVDPAHAIKLKATINNVNPSSKKFSPSISDYATYEVCVGSNDASDLYFQPYWSTNLTFYDGYDSVPAQNVLWVKVVSENQSTTKYYKISVTW